MESKRCWVSSKKLGTNSENRLLIDYVSVGLAPDVVIYVYLVKVNLLTPALKTKLLSYMSQGIQNELRYAHTDNSFSAFGNSDASGSSWLTAFVLRIFIQAKPYTTVDDNVITNGLTWLAGQQVSDASHSLIVWRNEKFLFVVQLARRWSIQRTR